MDHQFINSLIARLKENGVTLVAVSKTKPISSIEEIYNLGVRDFGENRVQELVEKYDQMADDIRWHMIGALQRNKVKYIAPFVTLIHSVNTLALLETIQKEALKNDRIIDILLQIKIATEEAKQGFNKEDLSTALENIAVECYPNINIRGFMGMATFTDNMEQVAQEFKALQAIAQNAADNYPKLDLAIRSFGMSGDFDVAIAHGANMVRIGSLIFGARNYN